MTLKIVQLVKILLLVLVVGSISGDRRWVLVDQWRRVFAGVFGHRPYNDRESRSRNAGVDDNDNSCKRSGAVLYNQRPKADEIVTGVLTDPVTR
jgi:hypothetical protein